MALELEWQQKLEDKSLIDVDLEEEPNLVLEGQMALYTIKDRSKFVYVKKHGYLSKGKALIVHSLQTKNKELNNNIAIGYTATKRIGNAVKRNRAKRIMRELSKKVIIKYGKINSYYVLIAKSSIFDTSFEDLKNELKKLIS